MDLEHVWRRARGAIRGVSQHLSIAHTDYIANWPFDSDLIEDANHLHHALDWKLLAISYHLEALWGLNEMKDEATMMLGSSKPFSSEWAEMEHDIGLITLESALFQLSAFLDLHMRYSLILLGSKPQGKMKWRNFKRAVNLLKNNPDSAAAVLTYYEKNIWANGCWGNLLRELRGKIAHKDKFYPRRIGFHNNTDVAFTWIAIAGSPFERLAEDFLNGVIGLLQDTTPIITGRPWLS